MKNLACSLAILSVLALYGVNAHAQQWLAGLRVGANLANQNSIGGALFYPTYGAEDNPNEMRTGFLTGLQLDRYLGDTWGISAELLYDQKGTRVNDQLSGTIIQPQNLAGPFSQTGTSDLTLNFLELSLLLKARFGSGDLQPYVFVGPSVGSFLSGKQHDNVSDSYTESSENWTLDTTHSIPSNRIKTFDVSIVGGAGVGMKVGSDQIVFLDAAYAYGFTNLVPNSSDGLPHALSRDIRLAAGILFPLN